MKTNYFINNNKKQIGGYLSSSEQNKLDELSNWMFDDMIKTLYNHKYDVNTLNEQQKREIKSEFDTKKQEISQLWNKKEGIKKIGFDFDGVVHIDVTEPDAKGVRHPLNHDDPNPNPFSQMHDIIKSENSKGNEIFVITARDEKNYDLIRNYLNKNELDFINDDHIILLNNTPKSYALRKYEIQVFYDDSPNYINNIITNIDSLPYLETLYCVYPNKHNDNNFLENKIENHKIINMQQQQSEYAIYIVPDISESYTNCYPKWGGLHISLTGFSRHNEPQKIHNILSNLSKQSNNNWNPDTKSFSKDGKNIIIPSKTLNDISEELNKQNIKNIKGPKLGSNKYGWHIRIENTQIEKCKEFEKELISEKFNKWIYRIIEKDQFGNIKWSKQSYPVVKLQKVQHQKQLQPQVEQNRISILSYNISWEAMTANDGKPRGYDAGYCRKDGWQSEQKWNNNQCFDNVKNYILNKKADIIALQEATYWEQIQNNLEEKYKTLHHNPAVLIGKLGEDMVTFYNSDKFNFKNKIEHHFNSTGRPYQIIEFEHKLSKNTIIFVNAHCDHKHKQLEPCILQNTEFHKNLNTIIAGREHKSLHLIIVGDHNDDYSEGGPIVNGIKLHRDSSKTYTCCDQSSKGSNHFSKYDWILYNKGNINSISELKGITASDHLPVYGEIIL